MQRRTTSNTSRTPRSAGNADPISMLMEDHKKVQKLFKDFDKAREGKDSTACQQIAEQACEELEMHTAVEEELFYPAAREALNDDDLIDEAEVEHQSAKELIAQLRSLEPTDPKYAATFVVLAEYVKHHIKEEEEELFPKARKAAMEMETLGESMKQLKAQLMEETDSSGRRDKGVKTSEETDDEEAQQPRAQRARARN
jgi:hemerythrin-like domain-containing protein